MVTVSKIEAGRYAASDGRLIVKDGSSWYVLKKDGTHDFGPLTTLRVAKQYVTTDSVSVGEHNNSSSHGRRQRKKEFNSYLAAEAKRGNYGPLVLWFLFVGGFLLLMEIIRNG